MLIKRLSALATVGLTSFALTAGAQEEQPTAEDLKALRKKISELEGKVKELEEKTSVTNQSKANDQQLQQLEQHVKILERNRELDQEAVETKAKDFPRIS